jgi:hypothetical protein
MAYMLSLISGESCLMTNLQRLQITFNTRHEDAFRWTFEYLCSFLDDPRFALRDLTLQFCSLSNPEIKLGKIGYMIMFEFRELTGPVDGSLPSIRSATVETLSLSADTNLALHDLEVILATSKMSAVHVIKIALDIDQIVLPTSASAHNDTHALAFSPRDSFPSLKRMQAKLRSCLPIDEDRRTLLLTSIGFIRQGMLLVLMEPMFTETSADQ